MRHDPAILDLAGRDTVVVNFGGDTLMAGFLDPRTTSSTSRGMTLDAVASAAGIAAGFASKLERDQVSPSVASLVAICRAVGLRMGELFEPPPSHVVRAREGTRINFGGQGAIEQVVAPGDQTLIEVIHSLIGPGGSGGDDLYVLEAKVEVVHVIRGHLVVTLGQERQVLSAGDTMTFRGSDPHTWANESSEDCEVIWMLTRLHDASPAARRRQSRP